MGAYEQQATPQPKPAASARVAGLSAEQTPETEAHGERRRGRERTREGSERESECVVAEGGWVDGSSKRARHAHTRSNHTHTCGAALRRRRRTKRPPLAEPPHAKNLCLEEEPREERTLLLWERGEETSVNLCALLVCLNPTSSNSPTEIESTNISLERYLYLSLYSYKSTLRILSITYSMNPHSYDQKLTI